MFEHLFAERGLSLDRLKTLIEVAKAGSIAAAARGDSARQSLYSRQIKELEEFFGVELAARRGKVLALTRSGWELVRLASESLCLLDDFKSRSRNLPYRFTIGAGDSLHAWWLLPCLRTSSSAACRGSLHWRTSATVKFPSSFRTWMWTSASCAPARWRRKGWKAGPSAPWIMRCTCPRPWPEKRCGEGRRIFHACWACSPWLRWGAVPASMPR